MTWAYLNSADLREAQNLNVHKLCNTYTLYGAELDGEFREQVKKSCPHPLEEPKD